MATRALAAMVRQSVSAVASAGVGTLTLSTAVAGYRSFATIPVSVDGKEVPYTIIEGSKFEYGYGVYTASGTTLTRPAPTDSSAGNGVAETFTTACVVLSTPLAGEFAIGRQALWIPAGAMLPRTTNGASFVSYETATNKIMRRVLEFDPSTVQYAQFDIKMPKAWDESTVSFVPIWEHGATTTNFGVVWSLKAVAYSDAEVAEAAFGTAQTSTDTGGTTDKVYFGPECSAITIASTPSAEDWVKYEIARETANGSDTMAVNARLIGISVIINVDRANDA